MNLSGQSVSALVKFYKLSLENLMIVHDFAYADIVFDGYRAPSLLQVKGAKEVAVEFFSLSKSYNMAGWRMGFAVGNPSMLAALARLKSYFDYGSFNRSNRIDHCLERRPELRTRDRGDLSQEKGCAGQRIEKAGFRILAMKKIHLTEETAGGFYAVHKGKGFYRSSPITRCLSPMTCS
jgi:aspartate/methionine/tyrosine aminotransferase